MDRGEYTRWNGIDVDDVRIGFMPDFDSSREVEGFDPEIMEPFYLLMGWGRMMPATFAS